MNIKYKYKQMQMRINLDQILGSTKEDSLESSMYSSSRTSELASSHSQELLHKKISFPMFVDQELSEKSKHDVKSVKSKTPSVSSKQSEPFQKNPGERLYYESRATLARKKQQIQRKKLESMEQEEKNMTFKPQINKNSKKIIETMVKSPKVEKKQANKELPTQVKKYQQQIMECTFKPELISKSPYGQTRYKEKGKVFEQLFNNHKFKKIRQKIDEQLYLPEQKASKKPQFESFLTRNNEYRSKVEKKKQLISITSTIYDLKTGNKLFSPQTNATEYLQKVASTRNKPFQSDDKYKKNYITSYKKNEKQTKQTKQANSLNKTNQQQKQKINGGQNQQRIQENLNIIHEGHVDQQEIQEVQVEHIQPSSEVKQEKQNQLKISEQIPLQKKNQQNEPNSQQQTKKQPIKLRAQIQEKQRLMREVILSVFDGQEQKKQEQKKQEQAKQPKQQKQAKQQKQNKTKESHEQKDGGKKKKKNFKSLMKNKADSLHKSNQQIDEISNIDLKEEMKSVQDEKQEDFILKESKSTGVQNFQNNSLKQSKTAADVMKIQQDQINEQKSGDMQQIEQRTQQQASDQNPVDQQSQLKAEQNQ